MPNVVAPKMNITLEAVEPNSTQIKLLYDQLNNRLHNISHEMMPDYEEHTKFVKNHPYRKWYIIRDGSIPVGNVYISFDNSIGLNAGSLTCDKKFNYLLDMIYSNLTPLAAEPSLRIGNFYLNVSATDKEMQDRLEKMGFIEKQRSYIRKR